MMIQLAISFSACFSSILRMLVMDVRDVAWLFFSNSCVALVTKLLLHSAASIVTPAEDFNFFLFRFSSFLHFFLSRFASFRSLFLLARLSAAMVPASVSAVCWSIVHRTVWCAVCACHGCYRMLSPQALSIARVGTDVKVAGKLRKRSRPQLGYIT